MNTVIKHIVAKTYRPLLKRYLSKTRMHRYQDLLLEIPTEVFHPGFFFSTKLLLQYINKLPLQNRQLLELGCGSGLIALAAAKKGAAVTATDINPIAVEFLTKNCLKNNLQLQVIHSDLFDNIPVKQYDIIAINPPYYKKDPATMQEYAWFCGSNGEYFERLFQSLHQYVHAKTEILMVVFDGCDMQMITGFAAANKLKLTRVHSKQNMLEKNFIYKIEAAA
ncbi:MAG: methyltransferase [Ferruginibacter sp.]|nr:methyltransferase [Ferruginibacter sp.]